MPKLPRRFPDGSKYVLEADGATVRRYVELPNGRKINLRPRKATPRACTDRDASIVPDQITSEDIIGRRVFA